MNVIVPINVEVLRVSANSLQPAKMALYDFSELGSSPLAGSNDLVAAKRFSDAQSMLKEQPGIHLHWSLPKAYTQGQQDKNNGSIQFKTLPNRWLVSRFFKEITKDKVSVTNWVLESDAHGTGQSDVGNSTTTIPWMDDTSDLYGMKYHYAGNRAPLTNAWQEPALEKGYLGTQLQAPFGYGETFTAYYQHCGNIFGLYDDLRDAFAECQNKKVKDQTFSISYVVTGWVSPQSNDTCLQVLHSAITTYQGLPADNKPEFAAYISQTFESELKWRLDDYSLFTTDNAAQTQAILSGTIAGITWDIVENNNSPYPSALPDTDHITLSIGNTASEAVSAFLSSAEKGSSTPDPGDVSNNLEWLLNALQTGRMSYLGTGEMGAGQLEEYLHTRTFGSKAGGYIWSVRSNMTPGSTALNKGNAEVALPLPLAKILAQLNDCQQAYDTINEEILTRQQKLFLDWNYHITAIENNVIGNSGNIDDDNSQNYLLDGIMNLLPLFMKAGASGRITGSAAPYRYTPSPFQIAVPDGMYATGFSAYIFNGMANENAATTVTQLLDACYTLEGALPEGLNTLEQQIRSAILLLTTSQAGGSDAALSLQQAIVVLQTAQSTAQAMSDSYVTLFQANNGLNDLKTNQVDPSLAGLAALCDPVTSVFAQYLNVNADSAVPLAAGQVYGGQMSSSNYYDNAGRWNASGDFPGIKDLLDQFTGQGNYHPALFDIQMAGIYLATAYFWRLSQQQATTVTPYYIQMAQQRIIQAKTAAQTASTALDNVLNAAGSGGIITATGLSLQAITTTIIPGVLSDLGLVNNNIQDDIAQLQTLLTGTSQQAAPLSIAQLSAAFKSDDWKTLITQVETAFQQMLQCLPVAQQVSILNTYLYNSIQGKFELAGVPADPYWLPAEPVILMAGTDDDSDLLKPVNRNGKADLLPCRLDTELVTANAPVSIPPALNNLSAQLDPSIPGLNTLLQQLATEGLMLWPEFNAANTSTLLAAYQNNSTTQLNQIHQVTLANAPDGFTGKLPYYTAYNRQMNGDTFQPLFIYWKVEYVYSGQLDFNKEQLPAGFLSGFSLDRYNADYQPLAANANDFIKNLAAPNFFNISGVIPLSSASTAHLCDEIVRYSLNNINYDPSQGLPDSNSKYAALEQVFYNAWKQFKTCNFLSQRLSGFNTGMIQRTQELQLPVNIPQHWLDYTDAQSLWPTQFLFNQSANWPTAWAGEAIDNNVLQQSDQAIYFNPVRAGFLQVSEISLVDAFGRFVTLPPTVPLTVAENLQSQTNVPLPDHPVYLPPRLIQPSRLLFKWVAADSPLIGAFTEWNPQPAASPVCGWLLPNHLDDSLMVYNNAGVPLGSMRQTPDVFRWFTVPGEPYEEGIDDRTLMLHDIAAKNSNPVFASFLENFMYPSSTNDAGNNFVKFLDVIEKSRQFLVTSSMQQNQSLAVLTGQPLVIVKATLKLKLKGLPYTSLDSNTYPPWNGQSAQFRLDNDGFIPYNFDNFNDGGIKQVLVPVSIGAVDYQKNDQPIVFFDDGLVGFFVNDDYSNFYTPVNTNDGYLIKSTYRSATQPVSLIPAGDAVTITMIMDPCASVHVSSSVLPVNQISLPPDQYARTLNKILVTFLTAPVLKTTNGLKIPVPAETGYNWSWWQAGASGDTPVTPAQVNTDAFFTGNPQMIIDGWLKLKKNKDQ